MGIQDRDYYRERYRDSSSLSKRGKRSARFKYLLFLAFMLTTLWYGFNVLMDGIKSRKLVKQIPKISEIRLPYFAPNGISLKTDRQGHFRGTVLVNNVPMPFLIDTGATKTVLPVKMAMAAGLPFGRAVQASTAGGKVAERVTLINSFKIGNAEIKNLDAHINEYLDEVLIGMNTLKYFRITQNGDTLTLEANDPHVHRVADAQAGLDPSATRQSIKKSVRVKKSVICDQRQVCKTIYSDH
jgi:aspartyl protease family protein